MASTSAPDSTPATPLGRDREVPLWRLYLMRSIAVFFVVQGFFNIVPHILFPDPAGRGMITAILGGLWVLAIFAIRYPLQLLPMYLFEFVWKTIWLLAFGLPQWVSGTGSSRLSVDLFEIGAFPFVFAIIIPWGYAWRHYIRKPSERWR
jgi:hypothetical protein